MLARQTLSLLQLISSALFISALLCGNVAANETVDLYTAEVLVINQTPAVRNQAAVNELATIFTRMSGNRLVLQNSRVRDAIRNASRYVDQFSYQTTEEEITIAGGTFPASLLVLKFTASPLETILREEQLPFWPANRPEVLVWMAESTGRQRYVEKESALGIALDQAAMTKGLPIVSPILDLQDRQVLPVAKIWAADERSMVNAAERYDVDAIISGRIRPQGNAFVANFILNHQGETRYLQAKGNNAQAVADSIMAQAARFFSDIYAVVVNDEGENNRLQLVVNNAEEFATYAKVIQYLQSVTLFERPQLIAVNDNELIFDISYNGNIAQLQQTLVLDKKLLFIEQKTVYETVVTPVVDEPLNDETTPLEPELPQDNIDTGDTLQAIALPPIEEDIPILQLVFAWQ